MKLIVGLGNPGSAYVNTRHNIGSSVVLSLSKEHRIALKRDRISSCFAGRGLIENKETVLAIPLTYMNLSGKAVSSLIKKYKIKPQDILIIADDLDLEFGRIKVKPRGSSAGHRGIASVIESLGSDEFCRLRLGIGRPSAKEDAADFVLSKFNRSEAKLMDEFISQAMDSSRMWLADGITKCMEKYNSREQK
ncbi:MAG: aminoacyl-tRNA hydrolase [Candidatus Omnitrophica bacterium]|nr:aminoacyl-tRNA hydrolase [Candidatus Omnitrophota bacterium]MDD5610095.1 aminoacyl-tRNA hydrolase [Candidatus Omnitrophota bacterium]